MTAKNNAILFESGVTRTVNVPQKRTQACAAFHPTNPDRLYIFSGWEGWKKVTATWVYHLDDDTYHQLGTDMPYFSSSHSCDSFVKSNGNAVSTIDYKP